MPLCLFEHLEEFTQSHLHFSFANSSKKGFIALTQSINIMLVRRFYRTENKQLFLYLAQIETAHNHVVFFSCDLLFQCFKISNMQEHIFSIYSRVMNMWETTESNTLLKLSFSRATDDLF